MESALSATAPLTQEMKATVEKQRLGFVATVAKSGRPNVSPKGTFVVVDDRTLAFGDVRSPGTVANIGHCPDVEVNFVDPLTRRGFRAKGKASVHARDSNLFQEHYARFDRWASLVEHIQHIVLINVQSAKLLSSPVYDYGAQEADLRAQWASVLLSN